MRRKLRLFSVREFERIFDTSPNTTKHFLETQVDNEFLVRLKRGVYAIRTDLPAQEEIANALYRPSYISFEFALAYYNLLPEMPYTVTSATTMPTRFFSTSSGAFSYRTIKREAFTGYILFKKENSSFLIAEKEKALVDYLYFVVLKKATLNDRISVKELDRKKIREFAKLFDNQRLFHFINTIL